MLIPQVCGLSRFFSPGRPIPSAGRHRLRGGRVRVTARAFVRVDTARFECRAAPRPPKEGFHPFCVSKID